MKLLFLVNKQWDAEARGEAGGQTAPELTVTTSQTQEGA